MSDRQFNQRTQDQSGDEPVKKGRHSGLISNLRSDVVRLADPGKATLLEDVNFVARRVAIGFEEEDLATQIIQLLYEAIVELPLKIPFYAAVIWIVSSQNLPFGQRLITFLLREVEQCYQMGNWRNLKLILRVLAYLQPILEEPGIYKVLESLLERLTTLEANGQNVWLFSGLTANR